MWAEATQMSPIDVSMTFQPNCLKGFIVACWSPISSVCLSLLRLNPGCWVTCFDWRMQQCWTNFRPIPKMSGSFHFHSLGMHTCRRQPPHKMFRVHCSTERPNGTVTVPCWAQPALLSRVVQTSMLTCFLDEPRYSWKAKACPGDQRSTWLRNDAPVLNCQVWRFWGRNF